MAADQIFMTLKSTKAIHTQDPRNNIQKINKRFGCDLPALGRPRQEGLKASLGYTARKTLSQQNKKYLLM